jgi:hypothetical protein
MARCESPRIVWRGARGTPEQLEAWVHFIRTADAYYARQAQRRGESYTPVSEAEIEAAAAFAIALGVTPADAVTWLAVQHHAAAWISGSRGLVWGCFRSA